MKKTEVLQRSIATSAMLFLKRIRLNPDNEWDYDPTKTYKFVDIRTKRFNHKPDKTTVTLKLADGHTAHITVEVV